MQWSPHGESSFEKVESWFASSFPEPHSVPEPIYQSRGVFRLPNARDVPGLLYLVAGNLADINVSSGTTG
jgi:hypothetical protein